MFVQNYFPVKRVGNVINFVAEFVEGRNGFIYLSQIRAMEVDYKMDGVDVRTVPQAQIGKDTFKGLVS